MDPNAAWENLIDAYSSLDWFLVEELATGLIEWLDRGGFPPALVGKHAAAQKWSRSVVRFACEKALYDARQYGVAECPF